MYPSRYRTLPVSLLVMTALPAFSAERREPRYELIDVGTLVGAIGSAASGINNLGEVAGSSSAKVFVFSHGHIAPLSAPEFALGSASAVAINDAGQVIGGGCCEPGPISFVYDFRKHTISALAFGSEPTVFAINDRGEITGQGSGTLMQDRGFIYDLRTGDSTLIPSLGTIDSGLGNSGHGINAVGDVTGDSLTPMGIIEHAFLYTHGGALSDLGTLGGDNSSGNSVNRFDQVTGWSDTKSGSVHAFLYEHGGMIDIGSLGGNDSEGLSINDAGEVTGDSNEPGNGPTRHAFLYRGHRMLDLNNLIDPHNALARHVTLNSGVGINDLDEIAANGTDSRTGEGHAYLLRLERRDRDGRDESERREDDPRDR